MATTATRSTAQDYASPNDWPRAAERLAFSVVGCCWVEAGAAAEQSATRLTLTAPNEGTRSLMRVSHHHRA